MSAKKIVIVLSQNKTSVKLVISDNGIGFDTAKKQKGITAFVVEKSDDGFNFFTLGTVAKNEPHLFYQYQDDKITASEYYYYRIKIIDQHRGITFSVIREVHANNQSPFAVYPNPTTGAFRISLPGNTTGILQLNVYDNAGKLIVQKKFDISPGVREVSADISHFASGYYRVVCQKGATKTTSTILKK